MRDGVWTATVNVPSTWNGTVRVTSIGAVDRLGNVLADKLTAVRSPAPRVIGTHRPALTFHYAPLAGGGFRIHGRAHYPDTGRPLRRVPLATAYESGCDLDGGAPSAIPPFDKPTGQLCRIYWSPVFDGVACRKTAGADKRAHARLMANPTVFELDGTDIEMLALEASAGDPAALNALLVAVRPETLRLCGRFLANREDAEEACQDTLWAVARGVGTFHGRSTFRTWLYSLAANRARSTYQVIKRRHSGEAAGTPLPDRPDPRRTSVVAVTRLDLLDALEGLPPDYAEATALRDVLGLSYGDIAVLLDIPEGTVKSRIHEARRRLRLRLHDHRLR